MKILMIGDIVGKGGRKAVMELVPKLRREYKVDFCIANGENMAGGGGITRKCINSLLQVSIDVITSGDHIWDQREFVDNIKEYFKVLRPANVDPRQPGKGFGIYRLGEDTQIAVINLVGRTFMKFQSDCPFRCAETIIADVRKRTPNIIVDFHAEATSEKIAMGRFLDGKVTAVLGTHTHVPTADEQIFSGGTAFLCDVGMVGSRESVLGRAIEPVVQKFSTGMPARFTVVEKNIRLNAVLVDFDETTGIARSIERIVRDWS